MQKKLGFSHKRKGTTMQEMWLGRALIGLVLGLLMTGCSPGPVSNSACGWVKPIYLDSGYETRLTLREKTDILAHDEAWKAVCGKEK